MFTALAWVSLGIAFVCAIVIAIDELRHPQKMWIMNIVWPVNALYLSVFGLWCYFRIGRGMAKGSMREMSMDDMHPHEMAHAEHAQRAPTWRQTRVSDTHCGAGCTPGDIIAEFSLFALWMDAFRQPVICRVCRRLAARLALWHRLSVLRDHANAQSLCGAGTHCCDQIRHSLDSHL